jgi:hypothetical protein
MRPVSINEQGCNGETKGTSHTPISDGFEWHVQHWNCNEVLGFLYPIGNRIDRLSGLDNAIRQDGLSQLTGKSF